MRFEPSGFTNNRQIPIAGSIMDYIFRYLSLKFLGQQAPEDTQKEETAAEPAADIEQGNLFGSTAPMLTSGVMMDTGGEARHDGKESLLAASVATNVVHHANGIGAGDTCSTCGGMLVPNGGGCRVCSVCGTSDGCG